MSGAIGALVMLGALELCACLGDGASQTPVGPQNPPATDASAGGSGGAGGNDDGGTCDLYYERLPAAVDDPPSVCITGSPIPEADFPRVAAETLCSLYVDCGCTSATDRRLADLQSCVAKLESDFSEDRLLAEAAGITYSADAAGGLVETWRAAGCKLTDLADTADCCPVYNGAVEGSTRCTRLRFGSDCAPGSNCTALERIPCAPGEVGHCGEGLFSVCGALCFAPVGLGERCDARFQCWDREFDTACSGDTGVCEALPRRGESCRPGSRCGGGYHCPLYEGSTLSCTTRPVCTDYPAPGEPCQRVSAVTDIDYNWGRCQDGSRCQDVDGLATCVAFAPRRGLDGAPCETSDDCMYTCVDGECLTVRLCKLGYFQ